MHPHKSRAKNQAIADIFYRAGFIETWGRGIGKVREEMEARGLKMPVWRETCGGIEVTIERETYRQITGEIGTTCPEIGTTRTEIGTRQWRDEIGAKTDLQKRQVALLLQLMEIISEHNDISYADLAEKTGKARSTIQVYMLYLSDNGYIKRAGDNYSGHWVIL